MPFPSKLFRETGTLFKQAASLWSEHDAPRLGAALAYYTVLSLAPMLAALMAVAGYIYGEAAVRADVYQQVKDILGPEAASTTQSLLQGTHHSTSGIGATLLGFAVLLMGASGVFSELQDTLNYIWDAPAVESSGLWSLIRFKLFAFAMVLGSLILLILSLTLTAAARTLALSSLPIPIPGFVLAMVDFSVSFAVASGLFALIYKVVPRVPNTWSDVASGAVITSVFFTAGKIAIGLYLAQAGVGSAYGAAGSLVVFLVWVYYSAQIFLYGAEFTRVYAARRGFGTSLPTGTVARS